MNDVKAHRLLLGCPNPNAGGCQSRLLFLREKLETGIEYRRISDLFGVGIATINVLLLLHIKEPDETLFSRIAGESLNAWAPLMEATF